MLNSLIGLQRAEPNPFLFAKIQRRLTGVPVPVYLPARTVWLAAASFTLLLLLNWRIMHQPVVDTQSERTDLSDFSKAMNLYPANNQLYDVWSGQNF